jgi:hypothetical protein
MLRAKTSRGRAASVRTRRPAWLWLAASGRFFLNLAAMAAMENNPKMFGA